MTSSMELFTREETLAGLPARRAHAVLFLIERRTAQFMAQSQIDSALFLTEERARERDLLFLQAFASGREAPGRPRIQDLEHCAAQWAYLVPDNPRLRAAVAHLLGKKYTFTLQAVPGIRTALGLQAEVVQQAYERLYGQPLATIYAPRVALLDRLRWGTAAFAGWVDALPPFWMVFAFVVAVSLPQAFLALPIVVARVGPLTGLALVLMLGLINMLTIACMAEALSRNGRIRYGVAFIGRVVGDYLGSIGAFVLTLAVSVLFFLALVASYLGLATTLSNVTNVPAAIWVSLPFCVALYLLSRPSLNLTASLSIGLGAVNIALILLISLLAFRHFQPANLLNGQGSVFGQASFERSIWQPVLGVMLILYFGHVPLNQCAKTVLQRDPSGRALIWGSVAGIACLTVLICTWLLAVNGAVAPQQLASEKSTVLVPLASVTGPSTYVLGSVLVILLLGLTALRCSTVLYNLVRERFPAQPHPLVILPCRQGRLVLQQRGNRNDGHSLHLTYLGLDGGQPQFRVDVHSDGAGYREKISVTERWQASGLLNRFPELCEQGFELTLEVLDTRAQYVRLRVVSPLALTYEGDWEVETLAESVQHRSEMNSRIVGCRTPPGVVHKQGRFWLWVSPVVLAFFLAEWLILTGSGSFARLLSIAGVLTISLVCGIFPALLLAASRRTGEVVPGVVYRALGHPILIGGIYLVFLAVIFLHGFIIWQAPLERAAAVIVGVLVAGATVAMVSRNAFAGRVVVELREDQRQAGRTVFNLVANGQAATGEVSLLYHDGKQHLRAAAGEVPMVAALRSIRFQLPVMQAKLLKVWAHRITSAGDSEGMPALLEVQHGTETQRFDLQRSDGQVLLPLTEEEHAIGVRWPDRPAAALA